MKPIQLIQSWNALNECVQQNMHQSEFTGQAKNILNDFNVKNEVHKWNELSDEERDFLRDKELDLEIDRIEVEPDNYANTDITNLQPFFDVELEPKKTQMGKLLEEQQQ